MDCSKQVAVRGAGLEQFGGALDIIDEIFRLVDILSYEVTALGIPFARHAVGGELGRVRHEVEEKLERHRHGLD